MKHMFNQIGFEGGNHPPDRLESPLHPHPPQSEALPAPLAGPQGSRGLIGDLISTVERVEQRLAHGDSSRLPSRFPWASDEEVEALENETAAMYERYR
jgi:hypothetical protein